MFNRILVCAVSLLLVSTGSSYGADEAKTVLVAYLKPGAVDGDAAAAARQLEPGRASFDEDFSRRLESPIAAHPLAYGTPRPSHIRDKAGSPRARLARYIVLEYPVVRTAESITAALVDRGMVGYVAVPGQWSWAAVPSDPFYADNDASSPLIPESYRSQRWFFEMMGFPAAWDITTGHSLVGMMDSGIDLAHPDFEHNLRPNQSWGFDGTPQGDPSIGDQGFFAGHGTHTSGLVAAEASSIGGGGTAGACWNCGIAMAKLYTEDFALPQAALHLLENGVQAINLSAGYSLADPSQNCPDPSLRSSDPDLYEQLMEQAHPLCPLIQMAAVRDVPFVSVAQNQLGPIAFPASAPGVIAVGGVESNGTIWDETDEPGDCDPWHCGSGTGPEQDFVAPAKNILSTFTTGSTWNTPAQCTDDADENFFFKGYDYCTGTSMAGPLVTGAIALLRSANPLLASQALETVLKATASNQGTHDNVYGYGIPDTGAAMAELLGVGDGITLRNRLTPMFVLNDPNRYANLFTTVPQTAVSALGGTLYGRPQEVQSSFYLSQSYLGTDPIPAYLFPADFTSYLPMQPVTPFWLFTTANNPFGPMPLVPLHRLSLRRGDSCLVRDHSYATSETAIDYFTQTDACAGPDESKMVRQGIEGYLLPACPDTFTCLPENRAQEGGLQCVYLRRRGGVANAHGWALILEDQLPGQPDSPWWEHTESAPGMDGCLGYAFTTMDSDGDKLIDGIEFMLGSNPAKVDTDGDCRTDAQEYPAFGLPSSDPVVAEQHDPQLCDLIFEFDAEL